MVRPVATAEVALRDIMASCRVILGKLMLCSH